MPKNIVICCDGTGNQFGECNSNVVKIYAALAIDEDQIGYYHPGVGTMGAPTARNKLESSWSRIKGLAFGAGFRDNVLDAYRYLMDNYEDGDRIFLFGFSRGAYTVRALAALLYGYGLLCAGNEGHIPYVWRLLVSELKKKRRANLPQIDVQAGFKETFSHKHLNLYFVGLWDTVSSIGWISEPLQLLYMAQNPLVKIGRHAISIDERRCFYQDNLWGKALEDQDILQVWFPGVHSDVGGSYDQIESGLSNIALRWLLEEAKKVGVKTNPSHEQLIFGQIKDNPASSLFQAPNNPPTIHDQLKGAWWLLEIFPHRFYSKDLGREQWRIPLGRRRDIPELSLVHPSVKTLMREPSLNYIPANLPESALVPVAPRAEAIQQQCKIKTDISGYFLFDPLRKFGAPSDGHTNSGKKMATATTVAVGLIAVGCAIGLVKHLFFNPLPRF
jgi:uncharacterized protein (DUF2235 family)